MDPLQRGAPAGGGLTSVTRRRGLLGLILSSPLILATTRQQPGYLRPLESEARAVNDAAWARLEALRKERKFRRYSYPRLGYRGPDEPEDLEPLTEIVNGALDRVLTLRASTVSSDAVRPILHRAMEEADSFATEDRHRVWEYLIEVWYILGLRTALFAERPGSSFEIPSSYSEPLPPGWSAPDRPRRFG